MKYVIEYTVKVNGLWKLKVLSFVIWVLNIKLSEKPNGKFDKNISINIEIK